MHTRSPLVIAGLSLLMALAAGTARANTIVVNSLYDPSASKHCTLHDAIVAANTGVAVNGCKAGSGNDTITFYVSGTIVLSATLPAIEKTLTISGPSQGVSVSGNNAVEVMVTGPSANVYLSNLTIENGFSSGGIINSAGIFNQGTLNISNSHFRNNTINGGGFSIGGAIINAGPLTIKNTSFIGNSVTGSSLAQGGAIISESFFSITITYSQFTDNSAITTGGGLSIGGAIGQGSPALITVKNSTFTGNTASTDSGQAYGGAVGLGGPNVVLASDTFVGNTASGGAGSSVFGGAAGNGGGTNFSILNSTFAKNMASGDGAEEVAGGGYGGFGPATVYFSTFDKNSATNTGSGIAFGGNVGPADGTAILANSIFANATAGGDCGAPFIDGGYNIADDASCAFTATGSKNNTNPKLSPFGLANNGGPTQTIALSVYSPAIDAIPHGECVDANGDPVAMDQRGAPRPDREDGPYGPCDIGAYEFQAQASGGY